MSDTAASSYLSPTGEFTRDQRYLTTRITVDGRDGFPVEPGRYRLVVSRACPWANRAIIVRRLLGLEEALSMGVAGPTHDARSWTFDLDPGGRDPLLGIERLQDAYFARVPGYNRGITVPAIVDIRTGQVVTNDYPQITLDLSTEWRAQHRPGAPDLYPKDRRAEIDDVNRVVFTDVNNGVYRCGFASTQEAYETAYHRLFDRLEWLSARLTHQRYLVGDTITEADVRLFTTLVRFDAVYHGHFKCNRQKLTEMPVLWAYARDLFSTPGFGDTIDFDHIKRHYYQVHRDINPTGIVPAGPDLAGWLRPPGRDSLGGHPFGDGTPPPPPPRNETVPREHTPVRGLSRKAVMSSWFVSSLVILLFILIGGYFSASEIALVSLREGQVRRLGEDSKRGRAVARLLADPGRFLSAVQIGVTFAGFFAASYGGATLAVGLQRMLVGWGLSEGLAGTTALVGITLIVSYVSLVLGELVPKRLALQRPETIALIVAPMLDWIAKISRPVIWLLSVSTNAVVRLLGIDPHAKADEVSEEELRDLVGSHEELTPEERRVLTDVFTATDRVLREVMVPRTEVDFLSGSVGVAEAAAYVANRPHSRYPVIGDSPDDVLGVVHVRDLLTAVHRRDHSQNGPKTVGELAREALTLPGSLPLVQALTQMRRRGHLAIIFDEYGGTDGIVTLEDLIEELVGDIEDEYDPRRRPSGQHADGSVELDGLLHRDDINELTGIELPEGHFTTLAGFVISQLGRTPEVGDSVAALGHRFTVTEMEGRRVARIRITPIDDQVDAGAASECS